MISKKIQILLISILFIACDRSEDKSTLIDVDGNVYQTVTIGNQTWMAENLRVTHYADGSKIAEITECNDWQSLGQSAEAYCFYDNDPNNQYGAYYTFEAAKKACPKGWHLPTKNEWDELKIYLYNNGYNAIEGSALKSKSGWNKSSDNKLGFNAFPTGRRYRNMISNNCIGEFYSVGEVGNWWSSTDFDSNFAYYTWISISSDDFTVGNDVKKTGLSVRYLKDRD